MTISITLTAADRRRGMTLAELERFVRQARAAGAADEAPVRVRVTLRQTVKSLSAEAEPSPAGDPPTALAPAPAPADPA